MVQTEKFPLRFFEQFPHLQEELMCKELFIFLDYDGTLTPIVATPDLAVMSEQMRSIVRQLADRYKVSIVSGRATDDVRAKVNIEGLFYAGSHGFEIVSPQGEVTVNQQAQKIRATIDRIHQELSERLEDIEGALVEHVKYTISVHYRLVAEKDFKQIEQAVEEVLKNNPALKKTSGKKVFEIRPNVDWDKGQAVEWILKVLDFAPQKHIAMYVGDDTTDEDAFRVIKDKGFGILVAQEARLSEARYMVNDVDEVRKILEDFIKVGNKKYNCS